MPIKRIRKQILLSLSLNLTTLGTSCRWNLTVVIVQCLAHSLSRISFPRRLNNVPLCVPHSVYLLIRCLIRFVPFGWVTDAAKQVSSSDPVCSSFLYMTDSAIAESYCISYCLQHYFPNWQLHLHSYYNRWDYSLYTILQMFFICYFYLFIILDCF